MQLMSDESAVYTQSQGQFLKIWAKNIFIARIHDRQKLEDSFGIWLSLYHMTEWPRLCKKVIRSKHECNNLIDG